MKKTAALLALLLLLSGCGGSASKPAAAQLTQAPQATAASTPEPTPEPTAEPVNMTESYRAGRQAYYDITGIWMPEAEGFEATHEANFDNGSICFDTHGSRELYEAARAALIEALGEPSSDDGNCTVWNVPRSSGDGEIIYDVYYDDHEPNDPWVYMNVH